jgi:hypothetical protein
VIGVTRRLGGGAPESADDAHDKGAERHHERSNGRHERDNILIGDDRCHGNSQDENEEP